MTRRARGTLTILAGIVAIFAGLLIPPDPWVLLWAPGILLVIVGYAHATDPRPPRVAPPLHAPYPSRIHVHDPLALLGHPPRVGVLVDIRGHTYVVVAYGPDWIDIAYPDQVRKP